MDQASIPLGVRGWTKVTAVLAIAAAAAVVPAAVGESSAAAQGWQGFAVEQAPGGSQSGWALGVTDDLGGPGVDIWNNNHANASAAIVDIGTAGQAIQTEPEILDTHGINFTDIDNDGDDDLIETSGRGSATRIFRNDGGVLTKVGDGGMPDASGRGRQGTMVDIDLDGDMDLITTNLDRREPPVNDTTNSPSGLYLNNGDGTSWTLVPDAAGAMSDGNLRIAQQTSTGPATPQIVITHASFALAIDSIGLGGTALAEATNQATRRNYVAGTGFVREVVLADFDGDLHPELLSVRGDTATSAGNWDLQVFDIVDGASPRSASLPDDSLVDNCRSAAAGDFDNDGDVDILAGCAHPAEGQNRNIVLLNDGVGNFSIAGTDVLPATGTETASAMVTADIDGDGWLDAFVSNGFDLEAGIDDLYMNKGGLSNHWLQIDLVGSNPDAAGAQVFVGSNKWQVRETGHRIHRSQDAKTLHFGLGTQNQIAPVQVRWADGTYESCTVSGIDRRVTITKGSAACTGQTRAQVLATIDADPVTTVPGPQPKMCAGLLVTVDFAEGERPTEGNDVIIGTSTANAINALGGNDVICGLGGDDVINGGDGFDKIFGGQGADTINGNAGNDLLIGGAGNDVINGGKGNDRMQGGDGADNMSGGNGLDRIAGGNGNDTLKGGNFADQLFGNLGRDNLQGGAGNDVLRGGAWIDSFNGGTGSDGCTLNDPAGHTETRVSCETGVFGR